MLIPHPWPAEDDTRGAKWKLANYVVVSSTTSATPRLHCHRLHYHTTMDPAVRAELRDLLSLHREGSLDDRRPPS